MVHNIALDEYYVLYCTSSAPSLGSTFQSKTYVQIPATSFAAVDTRVLGFLDVSTHLKDCTTIAQASLFFFHSMNQLTLMTYNSYLGKAAM